MKDADRTRSISAAASSGSSSGDETVVHAVSVPTLEAGTVLGGRYEILNLLGEGGMGAVYKARDRELDRLVALKVIRPELAYSPAILQRFKQELILARQVTHKNVIRIYDLGEADGVKFLTMEYVEGTDLKTLLHDQGKFAPADAVRIMQQICRALDASHSEGVIHRDLKPSNVMLDKQGKVLVMDFGLARTHESKGLTLTGALVGTPEYMAPEQAKGQPVDAQSDIYAAGLIFYELLTGKVPYPADSALQSLMKRTQERATPVSQLENTVPRILSGIVGRCLEPDRRNRYQCAAELLADLEAYQPSGALSSTMVLRGPSTAVPGLYKWLTIVLAAVLLGAGVVAWKMYNRIPAGPHATVSVLVSDFENETSDPVFDGTLEPAFTVAMEGAPFITSYNRDQAHKLAARLQPGATTLTEPLARLVATREGIGLVVTGSIMRDGDAYRVSVKAEEGVTGKVLANERERVDKKDVLIAMGSLAAHVRKALGDTSPQSAQLAAAETFTTGSLEAAHEYALGQTAQFAGKWDDAIEHYLKASQLDPDLGRAYVGLGNAYHNTGQIQQAEKYYQLALSKTDRMSDREKYRTRGAYYLLIRDTDQAIEQQLQLVKQYPADTAGLANLALAYFYRRDMPRALEEGRQALAVYPQSLIFRNNVGLFAMYAGEFDQAIKEQSTVIQTNPSFVLGYVGLALSELGQGHPEKAIEAYHKLESLRAQGTSSAPAGLADVALYEGRTSDAISILESGAQADITAKNPDGAATKLATLAQAYLLKGDHARALRAAGQALEQSKGTGVTFWAARIYIGANQAAKALALAKQLAAQLEPDPQAYAKLIEGEVELKAGRPRDALKLFLESRKVADTWMGRFDAGRAYVDAGAFAEAASDLEVCLKRRGEATAVFLDENPSYFVFPPVYYYLGRAQEGLKSAAAADSYKTFLSVKAEGDDAGIVADARKRLQTR
ncbi:MAG TPA: protein kinase [Terriglobales bacterium]|nr:protein kinase [Terriglobales bacterium]